MDRERYQRLKEIFQAATEVARVGRDSFLKEQCGGDDVLLAEVQALLEHDEEGEDDAFARGVRVDLGLAAEALKADTEPIEGEEISSFPGWVRYSVLGRLAKGGMGEVFRAFDPRLKRPVALKLISSRSQVQVRRFLHEAEAQARVRHDNVLEVYETGEVNGRPYIAMRFIDGPPLLETRSETSLEEKVEIMRQVAEAIHAAHRHGLVHRDVKPGNILIERTLDGGLKPYVTDFGISAEVSSAEPALTVTGEVVGTPWYMAPERVTGGRERVDRRSDIFSLGATLYEYLSGERPFAAESAYEMLIKLREEEPRRLRHALPGVPADLETIVMKCLERDPERRYGSARELAQDLERFLEGEPIEARPTTTLYFLWKRARRNKALVAVSLAAALVLLVMGGINLRAQRRALVREELALEFSRRVQEIENVMRMAEMAPVHDLEREKELVRELMGSIRTRLEESGLLGEGSGHFALGKGYLALGERRRAREHLERAWARGYRGPEVAVALGTVICELSFEEQRAIDSMVEKGLREMRAPAVRELQTLALQRLHSVRFGQGAAPEYLDAMVGLLAGSYDEALASARQAYQKLPWLHEARGLEGEIRLAMAHASRQRGDDIQTARQWQLAIEALQRAADAARSDADIHLRMCSLGSWIDDLDLEEESLKKVEGLLRSACRAAAMCEPERSEPFALAAGLDTAAARRALRRGGDPLPALAEAATAAEKAAALRPTDANAQLAVARAMQVRAAFEAEQGADPLSAANRGLEAAAAALQRLPREPEALLLQAELLHTKASWESVRTEPNGEDVAQGLATVEALLALAPQLEHALTLERELRELADTEAP